MYTFYLMHGYHKFLIEIDNKWETQFNIFIN